MAELRLGVLGGTFNPIHVGHLVLAESFRERLVLDRILFVPAATPPHKTAYALAAPLHRYAMVSLAVAGHPAFAVSDVEMRRSGPSYSVETLERLAREWPGALLVFLMGSDTFLDLPTWRTPEQLPTWAALAVGYRAGSDFKPDGPAARAVLDRLGRRAWVRVPPADPTDPGVVAAGSVLLVETVSLPVSAQDLRRRLQAGESVRYRVPLAVAEYIGQHRLYAEPGS
jgi:nicotinate-nucleotide adenylyltransferase